MAADLHIHTSASDGTDSIAELLGKVQKAGLMAFAITDHDTISAAIEIEPLVPAGIRYIRGVEFSCRSPKGKCHILGYGYDPNDRLLRNVLDTVNKFRLEKLEDRLAYLHNAFGIRLTREEEKWLRGQISPGKPHLAQILVNRGIALDIQTAINQYINLHVSSDFRISARTAIEAIQHSGGTAIWAHPLGGEGEKRLSEAEFSDQLSELLSYEIQGMECFYSRYKLPEIQYLMQKAQTYGLLVSGGSDYHGANKPDLCLGALSAEGCRVDCRKLTVLR